jgi:hypothetical protein
VPIDSLISQNAPSLINGVSRQPAAQRLASQCEEQINMISDVALGVSRRPGAEHIAELPGPVSGSPPTGGYYTHLINRGDGQQFVAIIEDGDVNVYNLTTGAEVTVADGAASSAPTYTYLNITPSASVTAENSYEAITVADYTFIVNKRITTALSGTPGASRTQAHEFFVSFKQGLQAYERITMSFGATGITMPSTGDLSTQEVIDQICTGLGIGTSPSNTTGVTAGSTNWRFTRYGKNLLYGYQFQSPLEALTFTVGNGDAIDQHIFLATSTSGDTPQTSAFSNLPSVGVDGFVVKISGSEGSDEDEYYLKYNAAKKIWEETVLPGLYNSFNVDTMPHALVYSGGSFTFQSLTWASRAVGDTNSAPVPSFVGTQIRGITLHKNRLVLTADENIIATEAGNLFNFWPTTVTSLVDSDPFDIAGTSNRVSIWEHMVNFEGNISVFSTIGDTIGELVGATDAPLTIKNARVEERATYAFSDVKPVVLGTGIHFVLDRGGYSSVYRYAKTDAFSFRADEITGHAQGYIPANIAHLKSSAALGMLVLKSEDEASNLYTYRTHTLGNDQVMASWSKWTFVDGDEILNFDFIDTRLYILIQRDAALHLFVIDFGKTDEDEGAGSTPLDYRVHLDDLVSVTGVLTSGYTYWTLPYIVSLTGDYLVVKGGAWGNTRGSIIDASAVLPGTSPVIIAEGDHTAHPCYIGRIYESSWTPTEAMVAAGKSDSSQAGSRISGRLQLYRGRVQYLDTGAFDVVITSDEDDEEYGVEYRSNVMNHSILGAVTIETGVFDFAIGGNSKTTVVTLQSATFLPCSFTGYEWEGRYVQRSDSV